VRLDAPAVPPEADRPETTRSTGGRSNTSSPARPSTARSSPRRASGPDAVGGWTRSPACPSPRRTSSGEPDARTRSARISPATMHTIARIYSTSGTTGTPSFIPLTAADVATGSPSRRAATAPRASRRRARRLRPTTPGPSSPAPRSPPSTARPLPRPGRHRQHRAADDGGHPAAPRRVVLTPSYALHLAEWAAGRGIDLPDLERARGCWSPASPAAASRPCARSSRRAGAHG
jgi:hypothetical protein